MTTGHFAKTVALHHRKERPNAHRQQERESSRERNGRYRSLFVTALLLLSSCSSGSGAGPDQASTDLRIEFRADAGRDLDVATLQCGAMETATGFLAGRAHAACETVAAHTTLLTRPPDLTRACTLIYGGPETARVTGRVNDRPVDRSFNRVDGCGMTDWNQIKPLIDPRQ